MMEYIDVSQAKPVIKPGAGYIKITCPEHIEQRIGLEWVNQTYGRRPYFQCPICGRRIRRLYIISEENPFWKCRKCAGVNLYKGIQNCTKGGADELLYRMQRYAERNDIQIRFPFSYLDHVFDKRTGNPKFLNHLKVLQALENMRNGCIFFGDRYKPAVIRKVTDGTHPLLQQLTLYDLANGLYHWKTCRPARVEEIKL